MAEAAFSPDSPEIDPAALPRWDLSDLYAGIDDPRIDRDFEKAESEARAFASEYAGAVTDLDEQALAGAVKRYEDIQETLGRILSFASLVYATGMDDPAAGRFYGTAQERATTISTELVFFTLELNRIDENRMARLLESPPLARYRPWFDEVRAFRPYQLSDELEKFIHEKHVSGRSAWSRLFDETMAALRFEVNGKTLTSEETLHLLSDRDGAVRRAAALSLADVFRKNEKTFALITNTLAKDKEIEDRWRKYPDPATPRHLANQVEPEVVEALVDAVKAAHPRLSHRYYALKARWMGKEKLEFWDRNAPLPEDIDRTIAWHEARDIVLDAYGAFEPEMAAIAGKFFERRWIDAPTLAGKTGGAFSHPTVPSAHPYVLLNYQGKVRDVMTLAHELGHGVHQVLAAPQGPLLADTPLTLAETASVFGEMLTFRKLLRQAESPTERRVMIASKVEDMINTVVRQTAFYEFERRIHAARRNGELGADEISQIWLDVQGESLGPAISLGEGPDTPYGIYWCYIPHFIHSPFYVYAYAFGDCLVNSLYAVYEEAESGFQDKYFEMLKAGGTKRHKELLAPFGLDAGDPAFWSKGLGVIEGLIDELEKEVA